MFSCEFCEILRTRFFIEHLRWLLLNDAEILGTLHLVLINPVSVPDYYWPGMGEVFYELLQKNKQTVFLQV